MTTVTTVSLPRGGLIGRALPVVHYADAYRIDVPPSLDIDTLITSVLGAGPRWIAALMALRNAVVRPLGLKTGQPRSAMPGSVALQPGGVVGIFRVFARAADEVLLGENDRHLDFRVGVLRQVEHGRATVTVSTIVQVHNRLGWLYFALIRPFHRLIVPALLRAGERRLEAV